MAGVLGAASLPFIGCVALLAAMVLQILSYATPYWAEVTLSDSGTTADIGLWRKANCLVNKDKTGCMRTDHMNYKYTGKNHPHLSLDARPRGAVTFHVIKVLLFPVSSCS